MTHNGTFSLGRAVALLVATLVVAAVLSLATLFLFPDWPQIIQMALPTELALIGAVAYGVAHMRRPWREAIGLRPTTAAMRAPLFLILIGSLTVFSELYLIIQRFVPVPEAFEQMLEDLMRIDDRMDLVATALIAVLIAPILEEALFRGVLLRGLARTRGPGAATIWTAAFFALYHIYNPWQVLPTFFLGLVLAWVVLTTRSLWAGILVHAAFNAVALVIFAAPIRERTPAPEDVPWVVAGIVAALLVGSGALLVGMNWLERLTGGGWYAAGPGPEPGSAAPDSADERPYAEEPPAREAGSSRGPFRARG